MTAGMKTVVDSMFEKFKEMKSPDDEDGVVRAGGEKYQAISHMDFKATAPTIKDDNPDLDAHDRLFDVMMENYAHGSRKPRAIDTLYKYAFSFKEGSTRRKVYERGIRTATRLKRLPKEAAEVLAEIRAELRSFIWETPIQQMTRLDDKFTTIQQGGLSHANFRALWLDILEDIEECEKMDKKTPQQLYIAYLNKLTPTLRMSVMTKEWRLDGPNKLPRSPETHEEVAMACGMVLEERANITAAGDDHRHDRMMVVEPESSRPYQHSLGGNRTNPGAVRLLQGSVNPPHELLPAEGSGR